MSSYHKDYLKVLPDIKGAQQVLRWPASKVSDWLKSIELGNYCDHLEGAGLHGAIMVLDVSFNDESLAQLLGIPSNKTLLRQHLMLSFMDVIGPVCAQGKLDARKSKHFHHLEPIWRPKLPGKKSRKKEPITSFSADTPLCPLPSQSNQHLTED